MVAAFYAYLWLREDRTPYYAGKGCGNRAFIKGVGHRQYPPCDRTRIVIFPTVSEAAAFALECALIRFFGRKDRANGCLRNVTDGGEGISGYRHRTEARTLMSQARIGNTYGIGAVRSDKFKKNLSVIHRGRKWSADAIAKRVATRRARGGFTLSAESRAKESLTKFLKTVAWG
jgi:hypothetical protein